MPMYNEAKGITEYLDEIRKHTADRDVCVVLVDDCSTDGSFERVSGAGLDGFIHVHRHLKNRGHGPSVLAALEIALQLGAECIVAVDGDGFVSGEEVLKLLERANGDEFDVLEGQRVHRDDPFFRKIVSFSAKAVVTLLGGTKMRDIRDANTPVRVYRRATLEDLLKKIPQDALTPNLMISMISRWEGFRVSQVEVECRKTKNELPQGTTWRARYRNLPSRRFMKFCVRATFDLLRFRLASPTEVTARRSAAHECDR